MNKIRAIKFNKSLSKTAHKLVSRLLKLTYNHTTDYYIAITRKEILMRVIMDET